MSEAAVGDLDIDLDDDPYPSSQQTQQSSQKCAINEDQDEQIASFIENHPAFCDKSSPDYKNKMKKGAWLKEVAPSIGLTPKQILTRFQSMRTDYHKLKRKVAGKSGQGQTKLTVLQEFKLRRYQFLDAHYRGKLSSSRVLGSVPQPESSSDEEEGEDIRSSRTASVGASAGTSSGAKRQDSTESLPTPKKSKKKEAKKGVTEVLMELLSDSRNELRQSQATLTEAASSAGPSPSTNALSERETWARWLSSVHQDIAPELWRAYQKETFDVAMRYVLGQQQPPQPGMPQPQQPPQHQISPQQQQQPLQYLPVPQQQFAQPPQFSFMAPTQPTQQTAQLRPMPPRARSAPLPGTSMLVIPIKISKCFE